MATIRSVWQGTSQIHLQSAPLRTSDPLSLEMWHGGNILNTYPVRTLLYFMVMVMAIPPYLPLASSVLVPSSNCYVLDNSSYLFDFTDWMGQTIEYEGEEREDLAVRFCKDVESRSQMGYIAYGRYAGSQSFRAGSGSINFVQKYYNGDLRKCEYSFDKLGRTAQLNIRCGDCLNGACRGNLGCICSVLYDEKKCRALIELALPCDKRGPRVFQGFTVGFHPRSWEIVYNGMTQMGYEKFHKQFSFGTEQTSVSLYLTAISSISGLVGKPTFKIYPNEGLEMRLSGSGASGSPPTTLSPSVLIINWRCEKARNIPYSVNISIPIENYDPVEFTLTKSCAYKQGREDDGMRGWAVFGVISCIAIALSTISCCGAFIYKTRVENQRGLDALPGMSILAACLEAMSGPRHYAIGEDNSGDVASHASWDQSSSTQGTQRPRGRRYGSI